MLRSKSRAGGGIRLPAKYRYWTCGHCGEGLISFNLNEQCPNTSCGHRRDNYSTLYNSVQAYDTPGVSIPLADEFQSHKPAARRELSSSVAKTGKTKARLKDRVEERTEKRLLYEDIIKHVAKLLIQDDNLSFLWKEIFLLCKAILFKLGQDQFMKDFRRLLECFYLDLLHHATTDLERATSHVLRSQLIRDIRDIGLNVEQSISTVLASFFRAELVKSPKILSDPYQGGKVNSDEDKDDDNDEMDDWTARAVPDFTEMRRFMIGSNAFRNLVTSCRTLLLPPHLRSLSRVIMTIPDNRLWFSEREDLSIANKFKAFAEQLSNEEWCWWPLRPRMRSLQKDETRLHWQCHCGKHLWTEISISDEKIMRDFLKDRGSVNEYNHLCTPRRRPEPIGRNLDSDGIRYASPSESSHQKQDRSAVGSSSSQNSPVSIINRNTPKSSTQNTSTTQRVQARQQQAPHNAISVQGVDQSVVLFGIKGPRITLELAQIDAVKHGTDNLFFLNLREEYKQRRGRLRYWLSIWRLSHCDFVKFEKIWADRIVCRGKDLPTDSLYDYDPRPPHADNPPISQHEFEVAFASCSDHCKLALLHDCQRIPDRDLALKCIPKRRLEVEIKTDEREHIWGLQAQHVISFLRVLLYHCLILSGTFGFWAGWLVKHPNDLQNAAIPLTTALALLSLFWSSAGILKSARESV